MAAVGFPEERTRVISGFVEQTLVAGQTLPEQACFACVDMDLYQPIKFNRRNWRARLAELAMVGI